MDERSKVIEALDIIGSSREVVVFLRDVGGCHSIREEISPVGFEGLSRILEHVNIELIRAVDLLQEAH